MAMQEAGQGEPGGGAHVRKAHHTEQQRHNVAEDHAQQNGGQLADPLAVVVEHHDRRQRQGRHQPILPGTVYQGLRQAPDLHHGFVGVGGAAGHIIDGGGVQGKTDGEHHRAGDDRREQQADLFHEDAHDDGHRAAHQHGAGDGADAAAGGGDGLHTGDIGEADAKDHRQPGAEPPADGEKLQKGGHGGHDQRRLNQKHPVRLGKADGAGDDNGRRDAAHDHGHQMLQGQGNRCTDGGSAAKLKQQFLAGRWVFHGGSLLAGNFNSTILATSIYEFKQNFCFT